MTAPALPHTAPAQPCYCPCDYCDYLLAMYPALFLGLPLSITHDSQQNAIGFLLGNSSLEDLFLDGVGGEEAINVVRGCPKL